MSLPLVTRFGADPLLDLEVANKRYVDGLIPTASGFMMWQNGEDSTITDGNFMGYGALQTDGGTEAGRGDIMTRPCQFTRHVFNVITNTQAGTVVIQFRVNEADGNASLSIPTLDTGRFITTTTDNVLLDQLIAFQMDMFDANTFKIRGHASGGVMT